MTTAKPLPTDMAATRVTTDRATSASRTFRRRSRARSRCSRASPSRSTPVPGATSAARGGGVSWTTLVSGTTFLCLAELESTGESEECLASLRILETRRKSLGASTANHNAARIRTVTRVGTGSPTYKYVISQAPSCGYLASYPCHPIAVAFPGEIQSAPRSLVYPFKLIHPMTLIGGFPGLQSAKPHGDLGICRGIPGAHAGIGRPAAPRRGHSVGRSAAECGACPPSDRPGREPYSAVAEEVSSRR